VIFSDLLREITKVLRRPNHVQKKNGPSLESRRRLDSRHFLVNVFGICFQLRNDLLDGKSRQPGLASSGTAAELRFHVIDIIRGIKALRIGPDEIERGTRRISPLV